MEDEGRFIGVLEQELLQDVEHDGGHDKRGDGGGDENRKGCIGGKVAQKGGDLGEETHEEEVEGTKVQRLGGGEG